MSDPTSLPSSSPVVQLRRVTALVLCAGAAWLVPARAQSGSAPVGAMTYSVAENATLSIGVPLLRPAVLVAEIATVTGETLAFGGTDAGVTVALAEGAAYFAEVVAQVDGTGGALIGHRFEVDEAATRAAGAGKLVLDPASPLNTGGTGVFAGLAKYRVAIRPHWTLATLFGTGAAAKLNAGTSPSTADQALAWNGTGFSVYYFRNSSPAQWRNPATGAANQNDAIVPPGAGVFFRRRAGALALTVVGEVRTHPFVRAAFGPSQLVAGGFPVDTSPADWKLTGGSGLTAGTGPANADQLLNWSGAAFTQFYLRSGVVPEWRNTATGLLDHSNARVFSAAGATLLLLRSAGTGTPPPPLVQAVPFSL